MKIWQRETLILGFFVVLTLLLTWPVVGNLTTHIAGFGGDPWQTAWRFEEVESQIGTGEYWKKFFGGGEARLVNNSVLPWIWLQLIFGQPVAYNLVWLISFLMSGYVMYWLVRYLTKSDLAGIVSGIYYMLLPYHFAHAGGHFGAMQIQWLPLIILITLMFIKRPSFWLAISLGLVVSVQSMTEHHYMLWLIVFGLISLVWWRISPSSPTPLPIQSSRPRREQVEGRQNKLHYLLAGVIIFVLGVLPWWPTVKLAFSEGSHLELGQDQTIRFSADLLSWITPAVFHPIWGFLSQINFTGNETEATQFLGWSALLLIAFFHQKIPKNQKWFWLIVGVVFGVISLGPRLHVFGNVLAIPLPYDLVDDWPVFSAMRAVSRAGVMVGLAMAVLLGFVLKTQIRRKWLLGLVSALIIIEFLAIPVRLVSFEISPGYRLVQAAKGTRLVEIPAATNYALASRALYASREHKKEVVGSIALERASDRNTEQEVRSLPGLRQLLYLRTTDLRELRTDFMEQDLRESLSDVLQYLDVDSVLVHSDSISDLQKAAIDNFLRGMYGTKQELDDSIVYQNFIAKGDGVFVTRNSDWQVVRDKDKNRVISVVKDEAMTKLYNVSNLTQKIRISFEVPENEHGSFIVVRSDGFKLDFSGVSGNTSFELELEPGVTNFKWENKLTQELVLHNLKLERL